MIIKVLSSFKYIIVQKKMPTQCKYKSLLLQNGMSMIKEGVIMFLMKLKHNRFEKIHELKNT